jgi:diguanylate cyclase (GGDEF)-like protein
MKATSNTKFNQLHQECHALRQENQSLRKQVEEMATQVSLAYHDPLTGLRNRRFFDERLQEEYSRAQRDQNYVFSLVMIDINDFKQINDQKGHATGDKVLKQVANEMLTHLRINDICCRLGGDEFVIILPGADQKQSEQLRQRLRSIRISLPVTLSIGCACYPQDAQLPKHLLDLADERMYADKRRHKNKTLLDRLLQIWQDRKEIVKTGIGLESVW